LFNVSNSSIFEVVKMQNFSNCDKRRGIHFGVSGLEHFEPGDNKMGNFMSVSAIYLLSGNFQAYGLIEQFYVCKCNILVI